MDRLYKTNSGIIATRSMPAINADRQELDCLAGEAAAAKAAAKTAAATGRVRLNGTVA